MTATQIAAEELETVREVMRMMPPELKDRGYAYRDALTKIYWALGDWVNECTVWAFADGLTKNKQVVCAACAGLIDNSLGRDTLGNYAKVAAKISSTEDRIKYDVFPFSHIEYFAKFPAGAERDKVVEADLESMDERGGALQSKAALEKKYEPHKQSRVYQQTIASVDIVTEQERVEVRAQIMEKLVELEGLLDKAAVIDAEGAVLISRVLAMLHRALKKVTGWK